MITVGSIRGVRDERNERFFQRATRETVVIVEKMIGGWVQGSITLRLTFNEGN